MTPQAGRPPALPVFLLSSLPPLPRSSVPACTTTVRPSTLSGPISLMNLSVVEPLPLPWPSVSKLPRSPTWRLLSSGAPCSWLCGLTGGERVSFWIHDRGRGIGTGGCNLQCGPALVQPLVLSPKVWTWMPRLALASLPVTSHEILVSEPSDSCSR